MIVIIFLILVRLLHKGCLYGMRAYVRVCALCTGKAVKKRAEILWRTGDY